MTMTTTMHYATLQRACRDGYKTAWLAGPFATREEALAILPRAREAAEAVDPWCDFDATGTASRTAHSHPAGVLNDRLGLSLDTVQAPRNATEEAA